MDFTETTTTDAKRLVRSDFWKSTARHLRRFARPRVVTLAGMNPKEELRLIRRVMPSAHVTMIDREMAACLLARAAGADDVMCGDIFDWVGMPWTNAHAINLDLCGFLTPEVVAGCVAYAKQPTTRVLMLTISYGREREKFTYEPYLGLPRALGGRVRRVAERIPLTLDQVRPYKGNQANMCSMLWRK